MQNTRRLWRSDLLDRSMVLIRNAGKVYDLGNSSRATSTLTAQTRTIRCCESLYAQWSELKPFLPAPHRPNLTLPVTYLRSTGASPKAVRIVAFHGAPGSSEHYRRLGQALTSKADVDFIAINFPDFRYTVENREYFHSTEEKLAITGSLLKQLEINEVDLVIGHSAGTYAALLMCLGAVEDVRSRSLALLCSTTARKVPLYDPEWFHAMLMRGVYTPGVQQAVFAVYWLVKTSMGLRKMSTMDSVIAVAAQYATRYWDPKRAPKWFEELRKKDVPRIAMYSEKDRAVSAKLSRLLAVDMGNPNENDFIIYEGKTDNDLRVVNTPNSPLPLPEIVCFKDGGHNIFDQYPNTIADHLLGFLERNNIR